MHAASQPHVWASGRADDAVHVDKDASYTHGLVCTHTYRWWIIIFLKACLLSHAVRETCLRARASPSYGNDLCLRGPGQARGGDYSGRD